AAEITDPTPLSSYSQPIHIKFNKPVVRADVEKYTSLSIIEGAAPQPVTAGITMTYDINSHQLTIVNAKSWEQGAKYEIFIDAPNIGQGVGDQRLQNDPIKLDFSTVAFTPTATRTSMPTRTPSP